MFIKCLLCIWFFIGYCWKVWIKREGIVFDLEELYYNNRDKIGLNKEKDVVVMFLKELEWELGKLNLVLVFVIFRKLLSF